MAAEIRVCRPWRIPAALSAENAGKAQHAGIVKVNIVRLRIGNLRAPRNIFQTSCLVVHGSPLGERDSVERKRCPLDFLRVRRRDVKAAVDRC